MKHWTQTAAGKKRMSEALTKSWAKRKNGANGTNGKAIMAVEYHFENGENKLVYCRRKDDPKVAHV